MPIKYPCSALAWSQSGSLLATGSDDRRVILWKLGSSDEHPQAVQIVAPHARQRGYPKLDLAQADVIETGHRANIFNIKWAPNCSDQRLFTCAGDSQVRVFDLSRATTSSFIDRRLESGKEYKIWQEGQGACTRVLRCHSGRVKKISTENSPDIFLTAAEDGEVRQTDLRVPHTCSRSQSYGQGCPRPLMQFKMELYSISVSKLEPWLFAIAGTSDKVYLQDRRMIPRLLKNEWGSFLDEETAALTHCVRRFAREPKTGDGEDNAAATRRFERGHVTAVKISEANGRDLIASYSADGVYRFDMKGEPGLSRRKDSGLLPSSSTKRRKTSSSGTLTPRADAQDNVDWNKIRAKTIQILFSSGLDTVRISKTYSQLSKDLDCLADHVQFNSASTAWLASEESVIALCQTLLHIKRCTVGRTETVDLDLDAQRENLEDNLSADVRDEFVSLIDELQEANKWKAYSEEVKIRVLLWDRAEEYVKSLWESREVHGQEAAPEQELADEIRIMEEDSTSEEPTSTDTDLVSFQRRFEAIAGEESSDDLGEEERDSLLRAFMENAPSELDMEEDEFTMDEDDDEEILPSTGEEESSDEEESNRHGISGGNASIVYPSACYLGHANNETVKDCGFLGSNDEYIWSGSDCGHFFVWTNDERAELKGIWKGDGSVVNVLTSHPVLPICAVSGIDSTVKIFGPVCHGDKRFTDSFDRREDIMSRNNQQER